MSRTRTPSATPPETSPKQHQLGYVLLELPPTREIQRNSEGSFATLSDGGLAFYYTQFYGGDEDHSAARIVAIQSADDGRSWTEPRVIVGGVDGHGLNVMSVSLLRLASGRLALFYLMTKSVTDCRPLVSVSSDEGLTWTQPRWLIGTPGYFVLNNDRVIETRAGRLIVPMNLHEKAGDRGTAVWCFSDDEGATWRISKSHWGVSEGQSGLQESGVVETDDGSLLTWARTDLGCQYESRSVDGGLTWSAPKPGNLISPLSAASIKRLPCSGRLLAVYNDHSGKFPFTKGNRTPLVLAVSDDHGASWHSRRIVEADTSNWYHYVALHFTSTALLLAYNAGNDRMAKFTSPLRIRRIDLSCLDAAA
jgi:hypothetical protein